MSGTKNFDDYIELARVEYPVFLKLYVDYNRDLLSEKENKIVTNFMNREAVSLGYIDAMSAYQEIVLNGFQR